MKKSLLLVVLTAYSAITFAQTSATVSGEARMFGDHTTVTGAPSVTRIISDQSHVGIGASESLGSGVVVRANVDTFVTLNAPTATTLGDRQATVGVSNQFGSVDFGRKLTALNAVASKADPFATQYGSTFGAIHGLQSARFNNGVFVESAPFAGFTAAYNFGASNVANVPGAQSVSVAYTGYGFNGHYAGQFEKATGGRTNLVGGAYTLGATNTTFGADYSVAYPSTAAARQHGTSLSVVQPLAGKFTAKGSYGWSKVDGVADRTNATSVGVAYALSKRTAFEAAMSSINSGAGIDTTTYGAGLTHAF